MSGQSVLRDPVIGRYAATRSTRSIDAMTTAVATELNPLFAPRLGVAVVVEYIRTATNDLRGSVSLESLPEMAARLASHRMLALLPD